MSFGGRLNLKLILNVNKSLKMNMNKKFWINWRLLYCLKISVTITGLWTNTEQKTCLILQRHSPNHFDINEFPFNQGDRRLITWISISKQGISSYFYKEDNEPLRWLNGDKLHVFRDLTNKWNSTCKLKGFLETNANADLVRARLYLQLYLQLPSQYGLTYSYMYMTY